MLTKKRYNWNKILQIFEENEFMGLSELSELHLQSNRIIFFGMQLQQLSQLQFLDIRNNSLVSLVPNQLPKTLQFIYIADNPFSCDCKFLSFLTWLNASSVPGSDVVPCISREADERSHEAKPCPDPCSCSCSELRGKHFMYLDCSSRNLSVLPDFLEESNETTHSLSVYLETRFNFEMSSKSKFSIHDQALGISLAHNRLQSFKSVLVHPQLLQLHFADNLLDTISTSFLYSLESLLDVTLSGNPWKCDCEAIPFRKWLLSKMSIVRDINKTLCSNNTKSPHLNSRVIWTLNDLELCPAEVLWYLISFGVLVLLLSCASGTVLYMKYQIKIKFWLYAHGFTFVKEEDLDKDKKYDAFLSYASEDEAIIRNYIEPAVERNKPNTVLCIHGRDFTGGATTVENISKSIHNSKRTIAFLSENFLNSTWCNHEFDVAYNMSINDKINRIIIVRVGELTSEVPEIIADHMDTTHYLTWGTRDFWGGFYAVLPEHQNRRVAERNMELLERPAELETLLLHR